MNFETHTADSMAAAAKILGVPLSAVRLAKRDGCAAFKSGRVKILELARHLLKRITTAHELPHGFSSWQDVLNYERAGREKLRRLREEGETISFPEARRQATVAAAEYFAALDRMADELPIALQGLSAVDVHRKLCERREQIRDELNVFFQAVADAEQHRTP